jgi:hypothetical protein
MPADDASSLPARYGNGRFGPGNPGRRPGSRNHASRRTAMLVLQHFERNRDKILDHMALSYTPAYGALIGRLLPRQVELSTSRLDELTEAELARVLADVRITLGGGVIDARSTLIELEAIMTGEGGQ